MIYRRGLFRFERRWTRELFNTMVPGGTHPDVPEGAGDLGADEVLDDFYRRATVLGAIGYRGGLWLMWLLPPVVLGKLRTFKRLGPSERDDYIRAMRSSRFYIVRQLTFLLKLVACTGYLAHPRVREAYGTYQRDAADLPQPELRGTLTRGEVVRS